MIRSLLLALISAISTAFCLAEEPEVSIQGEEILFAGEPTKLVGLRSSNALISDQSTDDLIKALDTYRSFKLNSVSVFVMGSRFGDVNGFLPDGSLNPIYRERLERILLATQKRKMITIVGGLYWGTSKAKQDLLNWTQDDANRAIANLARWLGDKDFTHVILDPDNEGMAGREMKWKVEPMIQAAKKVNPELIVANNTRQKPESEDLNMHFASEEAGKPWLDSESTPENVPLSSYWYGFSKETHEKDKSFHNYSRIGRYTEEMKQSQLKITRDLLKNHSGILLASTWLQCVPHNKIGGPFTSPGGRSIMGSSKNPSAAWNQNIDKIHHKAGILWWLEFVRDLEEP